MHRCRRYPNREDNWSPCKQVPRPKPSPSPTPSPSLRQRAEALSSLRLGPSHDCTACQRAKRLWRTLLRARDGVCYPATASLGACSVGAAIGQCAHLAASWAGTIFKAKDSFIFVTATKKKKHARMLACFNDVRVRLQVNCMSRDP